MGKDASTLLALFWSAQANQESLGKQIDALHAVALGEGYHPCESCGAWHNPKKRPGDFFYTSGASVCAECIMHTLMEDEDMELPWSDNGSAEEDRITASMIRFDS